MSQHDYIIADAAGAAFLADLNLAVKALAENNYGTTEPAVMYAHMWWADTTADILKKRNAANTGWISYMTLSTGAPLVTSGTWSGNATTATGATNININATTSTDTTMSVVLVAAQATGNQLPVIDSGLTYNANTNELTSTGTLRGNTSNGSGTASALVGVATSAGGVAIYGTQSGNGTGVHGYAANGAGVYGESTNGGGVKGQSTTSYGVYGVSIADIGVIASAGTSRSAFRIVPQSATPTGANEVGDLYMTTAGVLKACTVAGTPGTWVSVGAQT